MILLWRHPLAGWLAVGVAAAHAVGGGSWLIRSGQWGLVAAGLYIGVAAQVSAWCWSHYGRPVASDALAAERSGNEREGNSTVESR
jgi:hypothetical protein